MKITFISDTHSKHKMVTNDLPGGDLLIHAGDFMTSGYSQLEAEQFFEWFNNIRSYDTKVFIAGNHDRRMQDEHDFMVSLLSERYLDISYLQDSGVTMYFDGPNGEHTEDNINIYGSPWQPEFYNWAFNLSRGGEELKSKWNAIPENTDILITHGPAYGYLDKARSEGYNLGCELLTNRIKVIKPKIHVCGHIHGGYGYAFDGDTHYINAAVLDESYAYTNTPINVEWNPATNEIVPL